MHLAHRFSCPDVIVASHLRPVPFQDPPARRVDLDLPLNGGAGSLEGQVESPDACEGTPDPQPGGWPLPIPHASSPRSLRIALGNISRAFSTFLVSTLLALMALSATLHASYRSGAAAMRLASISFGVTTSAHISGSPSLA